VDTTVVDRRIRALALARECAKLGARVRTIAYVTGMSRSELVRLLFDEGESPKPGKHPESAEWLHKCNLLTQVEASVCIAIYRRMRELDIGPAEALVAAFKQYVACFRSFSEPVDSGPPATKAFQSRLNFDRAFDLVCHTDGIWACHRRDLSLLSCEICDSRYLTSYSDAAPHTDCTFCKLRQRYSADKRIREFLPPRSMPQLTIRQLGLFSGLIAVAP
jgi:flagellar transcriptional activator FlhC